MTEFHMLYSGTVESFIERINNHFDEGGMRLYVEIPNIQVYSDEICIVWFMLTKNDRYYLIHPNELDGQSQKLLFDVETHDLSSFSNLIISSKLTNLVEFLYSDGDQQYATILSFSQFLSRHPESES